MEQYLFEGALSVKACLLAGKRVVSEIIIDQDKKSKDINFIIKKAQELNVLVSRKSREEIDQQCSGKTHGGVICYASERAYQQLDELIQKKNYFLCILEGIEDPFNFGYCLRNLYAAGCNGVLVSGRNWMSAATTIVKSSAGASEYINIVVCENWEEPLAQIKNSKGKVICAQRSDALSLYEYSYQDSLVLAIGGEMRGLSKSILDASTQNIYIPYANEFRNAMNGSSATAIIAFEIMRQRSL